MAGSVRTLAPIWVEFIALLMLGGAVACGKTCEDHSYVIPTDGDSEHESAPADADTLDTEAESAPSQDGDAESSASEDGDAESETESVEAETEEAHSDSDSEWHELALLDARLTDVSPYGVWLYDAPNGLARARLLATPAAKDEPLMTCQEAQRDDSCHAPRHVSTYELSSGERWSVYAPAVYPGESANPHIVLRQELAGPPPTMTPYVLELSALKGREIVRALLAPNNPNADKRSFAILVFSYWRSPSKAGDDYLQIDHITATRRSNAFTVTPDSNPLVFTLRNRLSGGAGLIAFTTSDTIWFGYEGMLERLNASGQTDDTLAPFSPAFSGVSSRDTMTILDAVFSPGGHYLAVYAKAVRSGSDPRYYLGLWRKNSYTNPMRQAKLDSGTDTFRLAFSGDDQYALAMEADPTKAASLSVYDIPAATAPTNYTYAFWGSPTLLESPNRLLSVTPMSQAAGAFTTTLTVKPLADVLSGARR